MGVTENTTHTKIRMGNPDFGYTKNYSVRLTEIKSDQNLRINTEKTPNSDDLLLSKGERLAVPQKHAVEFIKDDRMGGGMVQCVAQSELSRSGWQPLTPPAALHHLGFQQNQW